MLAIYVLCRFSFRIFFGRGGIFFMQKLAILNQGHNHKKFRWGKINGWTKSAPPDWDRVNIFESLDKAATLPAVPLITPLWTIWLC